MKKQGAMRSAPSKQCDYMFLREAQRIRNAQAVGSSPTSSSKGRDYLCLLFFLYNLAKRLSWTKLRAHPVDDEASIMR